MDWIQSDLQSGTKDWEKVDAMGIVSDLGQDGSTAMS